MSGIADGRGLMNSKNTDSRPLIQAMLNELGLTEAQVEQLETLPYETLAEAYKKVDSRYPRSGRLHRMRAYSQ